MWNQYHEGGAAPGLAPRGPLPGTVAGVRMDLPYNLAMRECLVLAVAAMVAACTHERTLTPVTPAGAPLQRSSNRRVAIVLEQRFVSSRYEAATDGHTFVLYGAPQMIEQALQGALAGRVARSGTERAKG